MVDFCFGGFFLGGRVKGIYVGFLVRMIFFGGFIVIIIECGWRYLYDVCKVF